MSVDSAPTQRWVGQTAALEVWPHGCLIGGTQIGAAMSGPESPGEQVEVKRAQHGDALVLTLAGEIDLASAAALQAALAEDVTSAGGKVVVDLTEVTFIDSTALSVLIRIRKVVRNEGRDFIVVCPGGPVLRLLTITSLVDVFDVHDTVQAALGGEDNTDS
jgi:anti-sigma B factor antagonist